MNNVNLGTSTEPGEQPHYSRVYWNPNKWGAASQTQTALSRSALGREEVPHPRTHDPSTSGSPSTAMYKTADKLMGEQLTTQKAADKIAADMKLMRDLFLDAIGPKAEASPEGLKGSHALDGATRLSAEVIELLKSIEQTTGRSDSLTPVVNTIESMNADSLLSASMLLGELMCQANLALSQQTVRAWKANLRADAGAVEDRSVGAVVGVPTFHAAFKGLTEKGHTPSAIREAILNQDIELVLTAHPTEAQRRTILKKHKRIVELLGEHDKRELLTPGEVEGIKSSIRSEQVCACTLMHGCRLPPHLPFLPTPPPFPRADRRVAHLQRPPYQAIA